MIFDDFSIPLPTMSFYFYPIMFDFGDNFGTQYLTYNQTSLIDVPLS